MSCVMWLEDKPRQGLGRRRKKNNIKQEIKGYNTIQFNTKKSQAKTRQAEQNKDKIRHGTIRQDNTHTYDSTIGR